MLNLLLAFLVQSKEITIKKDLSILADETCSEYCDPKTCNECGSINQHSCYICKDNWFLDENIDSSTYGKCVVCPETCYSCRKRDKCSICSTGYGFPSKYSEVCVKCTDTNCRICGSDNKICNFCYAGYGLETSISGDKICVPCKIERCTRCDSDAEICTECIDGYYGGYCTKIPENCSIWNQYRSECSLCIDGYGLDKKGQCQKCALTNCLNCSKDYQKCQQCKDGYSYDKTKCNKCKDNKCIECSDESSYCYKCIDGYGMDENNKCVKCDDPNCMKCVFNYLCEACEVGYGEAKDNGHKCEKCRIKNCAKCGFDSNYCTECKIGFRKSRDECLPCKISNCKKCENDACICDECIDGYGFNFKANSNSYGECFKCSTENCATCNSYDKCTKCMKNYDLDDRNEVCIKQKNVSDDDNDDKNDKNKISKTIWIFIIAAIVVIVVIIIIVITVVCVKRKKVSNISNS